MRSLKIWKKLFSASVIGQSVNDNRTMCKSVVESQEMFTGYSTSHWHYVTTASMEADESRWTMKNFMSSQDRCHLCMTSPLYDVISVWRHLCIRWQALFPSVMCRTRDVCCMVQRAESALHRTSVSSAASTSLRAVRSPCSGKASHSYLLRLIQIVLSVVTLRLSLPLSCVHVRA